MRIQEQREKVTGCLFAGQSACRCGHGCVKAIPPATASNLYAAEFMLYAFHFANQMEAPARKVTRSNNQ